MKKEEFNKEKKPKKPIIFLILPIVGVVLFVLGVVFLITNRLGTVGYVVALFITLAGLSCLVLGSLPWVMKFEVKTTNYVFKDNKETLTDTLTNMSEISVDAVGSVMQDKKENLKNIADTGAEISKDAIKTVSQSAAEGVTGEKNSTNLRQHTCYCKHCGEQIDTDSKYCSYCGGKQ